MVQAEKCLNCPCAQQGPAKVTVGALGRLRMGSSADPAPICLRASPFLRGKEPGHGAARREVPRPARKIGLEGNAAADSFQDEPGSWGAPGSGRSGDEERSPRSALLPPAAGSPARGSPERSSLPPKTMKTSPFSLSKGKYLSCGNKGFAWKVAARGRKAESLLLPGFIPEIHPRNTLGCLFPRCPQRSTG